MNSYQRRKLTMGMVVRDYLPPFSTITAPLPTFTATYALLVSTINQILVVAEAQDFNKTGITESKSQLKANLCNLLADYSRKLVAYATFTGNTVLLNEIKISESDLKRLSDADLRTKGQAMYDRAQSNVAALAAYGILPAMQTNLQGLITSFTAAIPKPRLGIDEKKQATQQLVALFATMETALANLDVAIEIVHSSQVVFYNGYKSARETIKTGSVTLSVKGVISDAASGAPIQGAIIEFVPADAAVPMAKAGRSAASPVAVTKKSAAKGGIKVKSLPAGTYVVTVKKVGYADTVVTLHVNANETSELYVSIAKV